MGASAELVVVVMVVVVVVVENSQSSEWIRERERDLEGANE